MSGRKGVDGSTWLAFLLKDKYSSNFEKERLKSGIRREFGRGDEEICYLPFERNVGLSYYFFVRERDRENDLRDIYAYRPDAFEPFDRHRRISGTDLAGMMRCSSGGDRGYAKQGDIVTVRKGVYGGLHGIVLREDRCGRIVVGFKFCFGTVVESFSLAELEVNGNIFNYLKVPR